MSPFNAWVFLKGLETLELRMRAHFVAALELARWLERQQGVARFTTPDWNRILSTRSRAASKAASAASSLSKSATLAPEPGRSSMRPGCCRSPRISAT
jgi:O-acetylhomoserine/O-acetylserine sulfhydrylase-like pyridoxal-dependent enzyme